MTLEGASIGFFFGERAVRKVGLPPLRISEIQSSGDQKLADHQRRPATRVPHRKSTKVRGSHHNRESQSRRSYCSRVIQVWRLVRGCRLH